MGRYGNLKKTAPITSKSRLKLGWSKKPAIAGLHDMLNDVKGYSIDDYEK